ncbi:hypothetical protein [Nocardioides koreensis]
MDDETSQTPVPATTTPARPGLRDRVLGWRGVAGVALASVILGGVGGAVLGAVSDAGDGSGMRGGPGGGPGNHGNPPLGMPGQLPPSTAPQQGDGSAGS